MTPVDLNKRFKVNWKVGNLYIGYSGAKGRPQLIAFNFINKQKNAREQL